MNFVRTKLLAGLAIAAFIWPLLANDAAAGPVVSGSDQGGGLWTGAAGSDGASLSASGLFELSGNQLTITLSNTATDDNNSGGWDTSALTLSGVFFDLGVSVNFTTVSATVAAGSVVQAGKCSPGPCDNTTTNVGGEWYFSSGNETFVGEFGAASSGYIGGGNPIFGGPNLDDPANSGNGINFGIISNDVVYTPNGGLENDPLIQNSVVLVLLGDVAFTLDDLSNVNFTYGTSLDEPPQRVSEPGSLALFAFGMFALGVLTRRRRLVSA